MVARIIGVSGVVGGGRVRGNSTCSVAALEIAVAESFC
jgi:hypothetical protein